MEKRNSAATVRFCFFCRNCGKCSLCVEKGSIFCWSICVKIHFCVL